MDCAKPVSLKRTKRCWDCFVVFNRGENLYNYKGGWPECNSCGRKTRQYTSKLCNTCHVSLKAETSSVETSCLYCKKEFRTVKSKMKKFCNRQCFSLGNRGENNWKWFADRSLLVKKQERGDSAYKEWRKSVRDRDGWECKMSNGDCLGKVVAHHILPWAKFPELRYEVNNGITLCSFHHPRKRAEEMQLSPYFQSLLINET